MRHQTLILWARKLTILAALIALVATIYAFGATTPQDALASAHVEYVPLDWSLKPAGIGPGERFRLIFLSSTKRNATSSNIETYNTFVQNRAAAGHANIQDHASRFRVVGCTQAVDARDNTGTNTNGPGVPIYWVGGNKVADDYTDFYDGSWDDEANDRNELGNDAHDTSQTGNFPFTGCKHNGTESKIPGVSFNALGETTVRVGQLNSTATDSGPIRGQIATNNSDTRPFYALSPVFQVPSLNASTLSPTGAPHPGEITSDSDTGIQHRVKLLKNGQYRIDVKGSEPTQPGGTIDNPRVKILAGSSKLKLLNGASAGVSQTSSETRATGGGAGENSRLDIKPKETNTYDLLVHRAQGDNGTYTITVTNLSWPDGRRAPDITVNDENRNNVDISWTKSKKTQSSLLAPPGNYEIEYRTLSGGSWSYAGTVDKSDRNVMITSLIRNTAYEVRVRMVPPAGSAHIYRWGYATIHTDDCATSGSFTCSIAVNQTRKGRINYDNRGDLDGYTVRLVSGRTYVIRANGKSTQHGSLVDPYLELIRASDNSLIREDDDGGTGFNSKLTYTPTSAEDYNIVVSSADDGRGTYTVTVVLVLES